MYCCTEKPRVWVWTARFTGRVQIANCRMWSIVCERNHAVQQNRRALRWNSSPPPFARFWVHFGIRTAWGTSQDSATPTHPFQYQPKHLYAPAPRALGDVWCVNGAARNRALSNTCATVEACQPLCMPRPTEHDLPNNGNTEQTVWGTPENGTRAGLCLIFSPPQGGAPPPPPDQSDHRGEKPKLQKGKSCRASFGTQILGSQDPPCPPSPHPPSRLTGLRAMAFIIEARGFRWGTVRDTVRHVSVEQSICNLLGVVGSVPSHSARACCCDRRALPALR